METYKTIELQVEDNIATLYLNRPPVNVLNMEMMEEITSAILYCLEITDLKAFVIRAKGKVFSAGVAVEDHVGDKTEPMIHLFHKMFHLLAKINCPTVAVVEGAALGGGCELVTFCDISIATERVKLGQPEINLGLFPPVSAVVFPWLVGLNRSMELLLTGENITAAKACEWGLINRVVEEDQLEQEVNELLANLKSKSVRALGLTKKAVRQAMSTSFAAAIGNVEQIYLNELMRTDDAKEGLQSFMDKREPSWKNS